LWHGGLVFVLAWTSATRPSSRRTGRRGRCRQLLLLLLHGGPQSFLFGHQSMAQVGQFRQLTGAFGTGHARHATRTVGSCTATGSVLFGVGFVVVPLVVRFLFLFGCVACRRRDGGRGRSTGKHGGRCTGRGCVCRSTLQKRQQSGGYFHGGCTGWQRIAPEIQTFVDQHLQVPCFSDFFIVGSKGIFVFFFLHLGRELGPKRVAGPLFGVVVDGLTMQGVQSS
jgi:hypothetical protein